MPGEELTRQELEREVERLRARVSELERWGTAFDKLFSHVQPYVFGVELLDEPPYFEVCAHGPPRQAMPAGVRGLAQSEEVRARYRRAVEVGDVQELEVSIFLNGVDRRWHVVIVPLKGIDGEVERLVAAAQNVTPRRKALASFRETRQRYQRLLQLLPDAVTIADENERVIYVNEAGRLLLGAESAEQVQGLSIWSLVHPSDRPATRRQLDRLQRGEPGDVMEVTLERLDAGEVDVEIASVPILYEGQPAVLVTARDLSGRRAMERALTETQQLFYKAFHLGPAALAIVTLRTGTVIDANEQFERLTGRSRDELQYESVIEQDVWQDAGAYHELVTCVEDVGRCESMETVLIRADGSERTVLLAAQRIDVHREACMLVCAVDITDRKRAELAEQESRALLSKIFHASPAPITIMRVDDGRMIDVNEAFVRLTGYSREELMRPDTDAGRLWADAAHRNTLVERVRREEHVTEEEVVLRSRGGEERTMLCSLQRIQVRGEDAILSVLNDITQRKQAEDALRQAKVHAEEMEQVKTTLLTNLTHEVRTPLTVILGFSSVLRDGVRGEYERFVSLIERSGRRLLLMLDAMLDLAQLEAGTLDIDAEPCNAVDVAYDAVESLRSLAEHKGLSIKMRASVRHATVRFERDILNRVLVNLLDNAIKFTEQGEVGLRVDVRDDTLYVEVYDTGVGIEEAFVPQMFDPFTQESSGLERQFQGTGLGLSVSKRLVELAGGSISVESEKGQGSSFTIELPLA